MPRRKHEEPEQDDRIANETLPIRLDEEAPAAPEPPVVSLASETHPGPVEVHLLDRDRLSTRQAYIAEARNYRITVDGVNYHHVDTIGGRAPIWRYAPED